MTLKIKIDRSKITPTEWGKIYHYDVNIDEVEELLNKYWDILAPQQQEILTHRLGLNGRKITPFNELEDIFDISKQRLRKIFDRSISTICGAKNWAGSALEILRDREQGKEISLLSEQLENFIEILNEEKMVYLKLEKTRQDSIDELNKIIKVIKIEELKNDI